MKVTVFFRYSSIILSQLISLFLLEKILHFEDQVIPIIYFAFVNLMPLASLYDGGHSNFITRYLAHSFQGITNYRNPQNDKTVSKLKTGLYEIVEASKKMFHLPDIIFNIIMLFIIGLYFSSIIKTSLNIDIAVTSLIVVFTIYSTVAVMRLTAVFYGENRILAPNLISTCTRTIQIVFLIIIFEYTVINIKSILVSYLLQSIITWGFLKYFSNKKTKYFSNIKIKYFKALYADKYKKSVLAFGSSFLSHRLAFLIMTTFAYSETIEKIGVISQVGLSLFGMASLLLTLYIPYLIKHFKNKNNFYSVSLKTLLLILGIYIFLIIIVIIASNILNFEVFEVIKNNKWKFLIYSFFLLLELNQLIHMEFIMIYNKFPFLYPTLISGIFINLSILILGYTGMLTDWAYILSYGLVNLLYNSWYWIKYFKDLSKINYLKEFKILLSNN